MHRQVLFGAFLMLIAGCASAQREAFDPSVDERIGAEVKQACFSRAAGASGGYQKIGDWDAFVVGEFNKRYLLVFSGGCDDLGPSGAVPVFRNYGGNCRRRGEFVETARSDFGVTGGCAIAHIYEWDRDGAEASEEAAD